MTHAPGGFTRFVLASLASLALMCVGVVGCREEPMASTNQPPPVGPTGDLGTVIVDVDANNRSVVVHPLGSSLSAPAGVSANFYGTTTQIEHFIKFDSTHDFGGGVAEYYLKYHINNLLPFTIGTNSKHTTGLFPQDTMGVYVYYSLPPVITQHGTGTPTIVVDSVDGFYTFPARYSGIPQAYVFFKTILEPGTFGLHSGPGYTNQSGSGGIDYYKELRFHTTGFVSNFTFGLSVSAAWADPNEPSSRWKVFYQGDSLPNRDSLFDLRSEPDWRVLGTNGGSASNVACATNPCLQIVSTTPVTGSDTLIYFRSDSLRAAQSGYIAATMSTTNLTGTSPSVFLGFKDPVKLVRLGVSSTLVGFTDNTGAWVGVPVARNPSATTWRVSKTNATSASIYNPDIGPTAILTVPYASLPAAPSRGILPTDYDRFFFFGNITQAVLAPTATSRWTNVNYEIGADGP